MSTKNTEISPQHPRDSRSKNSFDRDDLEVCRLEEVSRQIQRGGYLLFEGLMYRGDNLAVYEGENVILKFDRRNILTLSVYRREGETDVFLARAYAQDLKVKTLSQDEAKAIKQKILEKNRRVQID